MIIKLITETNNFWHYNSDFWITSLTIIGIAISAIGLYYSNKAFQEAELAKKAANAAGIVVKTQEIMMELERISNECIFEVDVKFLEATNKLNEISSRVFGIIGIYKNDPEIKEQSQIIQENFAYVKTSLELANPSNPQSGVNDISIDDKYKENYVYNMTAPYFTNLINSLSTLKGILNGRLIKN